MKWVMLALLLTGCTGLNRETTCEARCSNCTVDEMVLTCKGTNRDQEIRY